jgi:hypothetical protein
MQVWPTVLCLCPSIVSRAAVAALAVGAAVGSLACGSSGNSFPGSSPSGTPTSPGNDDGGGSKEGPSGQDAAPPTADGSAPADGDSSASTGDGASPCPALLYPTGVKIQTFANAAMTATYADHLATGEAAPECFLDADNLIDPDTAQVYSLSVNVAEHFTLDELVGTEISQGYGHIVLMLPLAVASLEKFRVSLNTPVSVISGFRSPKHQEDVCNSLCGNPLGCPGTCANNSRHMFGDAFDLPIEFYTTPDEQLACDAGFKFAYLEAGTHLHIDQNPAYSSCVIE